MDIVAILEKLVWPIVTGLMLWLLKKHIDKLEKRRQTREESLEELMLYIVREARSTNVLATATAKAVQRIPDAHCNGDMTSALEEATRIQSEERAFLFERGIRQVVGK